MHIIFTANPACHLSKGAPQQLQLLTPGMLLVQEHHKVPKWLQSSFEILELGKCKPLLPAVPLAFEVWVPALATPLTSALATSTLGLWCGLALCLGLGLHLSCFGRSFCFGTCKSLQTSGLHSTFFSFLCSSFCKASASKSSCVLVPSWPLSLSKVKGVLASFCGGS